MDSHPGKTDGHGDPVRLIGQFLAQERKETGMGQGKPDSHQIDTLSREAEGVGVSGAGEEGQEVTEMLMQRSPAYRWLRETF